MLGSSLTFSILVKSSEFKIDEADSFEAFSVDDIKSRALNIKNADIISDEPKRYVNENYLPTLNLSISAEMGKVRAKPSVGIKGPSRTTLLAQQ